MKARMIIAALVCAMCLPAWAGKIVTDSIESKILGATVKYNVYLPNGFDKTDKKYPVVYLLHGLYGGYDNWAKQGNMQLVADELIGSGEATEMIIIMPNAGNPDIHNVYNGYFNMPDWNYEDFFFQELIPSAEAKYRGVGDKMHRAIMGLSMGGGGSTVYAQRHPDQFSSCYAMSAWLHSDVPAEHKEGDKFYYTCKTVNELSATNFVENATEEQVKQLRTVKWFFDCGDDDGLMDLSVKIHQAMRKKWVKSELRINNGVHNWEYWHLCLRQALPFASRNFDK
ncbi:MAG: alpha/beta fold hydrolase [Bacteroidales bacterium]|nr:alpha/beta fold hydrolase [Candidatus Sodaliphilus fimicaballi]